MKAFVLIQPNETGSRAFNYYLVRQTYNTHSGRRRQPGAFPIRQIVSLLQSEPEAHRDDRPVSRIWDIHAALSALANTDFRQQTLMVQAVVYMKKRKSRLMNNSLHITLKMARISTTGDSPVSAPYRARLAATSA